MDNEANPSHLVFVLVFPYLEDCMLRKCLRRARWYYCCEKFWAPQAVRNWINYMIIFHGTHFIVWIIKFHLWHSVSLINLVLILWISAEYQSRSLPPEFFNQVNQQALSLHILQFEWALCFYLLEYTLIAFSWWAVSTNTEKQIGVVFIINSSGFINRFCSLVVTTLHYFFFILSKVFEYLLVDLENDSVKDSSTLVSIFLKKLF